MFPPSTDLAKRNCEPGLAEEEEEDEPPIAGLATRAPAKSIMEGGCELPPDPPDP